MDDITNKRANFAIGMREGSKANQFTDEIL